MYFPGQCFLTVAAWVLKPQPQYSGNAPSDTELRTGPPSTGGPDQGTSVSSFSHTEIACSSENSGKSGLALYSADAFTVLPRLLIGGDAAQPDVNSNGDALPPASGPGTNPFIFKHESLSQVFLVTSSHSDHLQ